MALSSELSPSAHSLLRDGMVKHNGEDTQRYADLMTGYPNVGEIMVMLGLADGKVPWEGDKVDFLALDTPALWTVLTNRFKQVTDAGNESTIRAHKLGFNRHDWLYHIQPMYEDGLVLAPIFGIEGQEQAELNIAIADHDGPGMNLSRPKHFIISAAKLSNFVPELPHQNLLRVKRMILLHDEKVANTVISNINSEGLLSEEELYAKMVDRFGRGALLLILLDKIQLGRIRLTPADHEYAGDVMMDPHTLATAFFERESFRVKEPSEEELLELRLSGKEHEVERVAELHLAFRPDVLDYETQECGHVCHEGKPRVKATEEMHRAHREFGYPHMLWWFKEFLEVYQSRLGLMARAAFALKPDLDKVSIQVADRIGNHDVKMGFAVSINRGNVNGFEEAVKTLLDEKTLTYLNSDNTLTEDSSGEHDSRVHVPKALAQIWQKVRENHDACNNEIKVGDGITFWYHVPRGRMQDMQNLFNPKEERIRL